METRYRLTRDVTSDECSWLHRTFKKGEIVYEYNGCTYGCVSETAFTLIENETPFFELPNDAVEQLILATFKK